MGVVKGVIKIFSTTYPPFLQFFGDTTAIESPRGARENGLKASKVPRPQKVRPAGFSRVDSQTLYLVSCCSRAMTENNV